MSINTITDADILQYFGHPPFSAVMAVRNTIKAKLNSAVMAAVMSYVRIEAKYFGKEIGKVAVMQR